MALINEFEPGFVVNGALPSIVPFRQADSQTFTQGQIVKTVNASGAVTEGATADEDVLGVSADDADNGTADTKVGIWVLDSNTIFKATATTPTNVTLARIFDLVDFEVVAGVHTVNEDLSDDDIFYIVDVTAVGGRLFVKAGVNGVQWAPTGAITFS